MALANPIIFLSAIPEFLNGSLIFRHRRSPGRIIKKNTIIGGIPRNQKPLAMIQKTNGTSAVTGSVNHLHHPVSKFNLFPVLQCSEFCPSIRPDNLFPVLLCRLRIADWPSGSDIFLYKGSGMLLIKGLDHIPVRRMQPAYDSLKEVASADMVVISMGQHNLQRLVRQLVNLIFQRSQAGTRINQQRFFLPFQAGDSKLILSTLYQTISFIARLL